MKMLLTSAAMSAGVLAFLAGAAAEAAEFTEASVKGAYSIAMSGTITFAKGQRLSLPTWSVGIMRADGAGRIVAFEAMANVGGCAIVRQAGAGTYSVKPNGTGRVEAHVTLEPEGTPNTHCPKLDPALFLDNAKFGFDFVIKADGLEVVGVSWEGPDGPISAGGAIGQATLQVKRSARPPSK